MTRTKLRDRAVPSLPWIQWFSINSNSCDFGYNKSTITSKWKNSPFSTKKSSIFIPRIKFCFRKLVGFIFSQVNSIVDRNWQGATLFRLQTLVWLKFCIYIWEVAKNLTFIKDFCVGQWEVWVWNPFVSYKELNLGCPRVGFWAKTSTFDSMYGFFWLTGQNDGLEKGFQEN